MEMDFTEEEIKAYFQFSEKGKGIVPERMKAAKKWRDVHIQMYRKDIIEIGIFCFLQSQKADKDPFPIEIEEYLKNIIK